MTHSNLDVHQSSMEMPHSNLDAPQGSTGMTTVRLAVVYRPPPSPVNRLTSAMFFEEWTTFLEGFLEKQEQVLIVGDINFHLENSNDPQTSKFNSILSMFDMSQYIDKPTHKRGHALDMVVTRTGDDTLVSAVTVSDPGLHDKHGHDVGDHLAVSFTLNLHKPHVIRKNVVYRNLRAIDVTSFENDIIESDLCNLPADCSLDAMVQAYDSTFRSLIDKHAPILRRSLTLRPHAPWHTADLREAKTVKRRYERKWLKSRSEEDHLLYRAQSCNVNKLLYQSRTTYYSQKISDCGRDQKAIFTISKQLLGKEKSSVLPDHTSPIDLANDFNTFFINKVSKIHEQFADESDDNQSDETPTYHGDDLHYFDPVTDEEMLQLIKKSATKSCSLDPWPTWLLKKCIHTVLPILTRIVNKSLTSAEFPSTYKEAVIKPLLKKTGINQEDKKNYRPVSNLTYLSKTIERVVYKRLDSFFRQQHLVEPVQSAYREYHSTETALIKVQSDILQAIDNGELVVLVMLDLSSAFDTVDHAILLHRLENEFGIKGPALTWIKSYLTNRSQRVSIDNILSDSVILKSGVPQGSVLGPQQFCSYTRPVGAIVRSHGLSCHFYADDSQIYMHCQPGAELEAAISKIEDCVDDIRRWMGRNKLKLNDEKTEVILFGTRQKLSTLNTQCQFRVGGSKAADLDPGTCDSDTVTIRIGNQIISPTNSVKNLGVQYDSVLKMDQHVNKVCGTAYSHLRNIGRIRQYLDANATKSMVNAMVTSRLDYANALLLGVNAQLIKKLQRVQNASARMITATGRREHISPVIRSLHWLPVESRIRYKVLVHTYKAIHDQSPTYIQDMLAAQLSSRQLRSSDQQRLVVKRTKTAYGSRQFDVGAARLWNSTPLHVKQANTLAAFKKAVKTYLFQA